MCVEAAWAREEEKFPGTMVSTRQTAVEKTVQSIRSKLKDISNDVDAGAKRAAAPPSKTSDVGPPSTVPPVEQGITTRSRSAKKPQAKVEKKSQDDAKSNDDAEEVVAPTRLFDEAGATETTAVSSANGKKRKAEADGDDKYNKTRRVTRAAARKLSGASRPFPGRPTQPLSPPFFFQTKVCRLPKHHEKILPQPTQATERVGVSDGPLEQPSSMQQVVGRRRL